jgi:hypothetical protein
VKLKIHCSDHRKGHECKAVMRSRGLAVTPLLKSGCVFSENYFVLTHCATGRRIGLDIYSADEAIAKLKRLARIMDWSVYKYRNPAPKRLVAKVYEVLSA